MGLKRRVGGSVMTYIGGAVATVGSSVALDYLPVPTWAKLLLKGAAAVVTITATSVAGSASAGEYDEDGDNTDWVDDAEGDLGGPIQTATRAEKIAKKGAALNPTGTDG